MIIEKYIISKWFCKITDQFDNCTLKEINDIKSDIVGDLTHSKDIIKESSWSSVNKICELLNFDIMKITIKDMRNRIKEARFLSTLIDWVE